MQIRLNKIIYFGILLCFTMMNFSIVSADSIGIYNNEGTWALWNTINSSADIAGFGWEGTEPIIGDWDGDGVTDLGVYNTAGNNFLLQADSGFTIIGLGWPGVTPVVGDWDGNGAEEVGVYDNAGTWALWNTSTGSADIVGFGWEGTEPVVGDWDGDGTTDLGIYNRNGNNFVLWTDSGYEVIGLGWEGVTPVVGDWDGDGKHEVGVYDNGTWALWNTSTGSADIVGFGWEGTEPVVGDWDLDGISDLAIYNNQGNNFLLQNGSRFDVLGLGWDGVTQVVGVWDADHAWIKSVAHYLKLLDNDFDEISEAMIEEDYNSLSMIGQRIIDNALEAQEDNSRYSVSYLQEAQSEWALYLTDLSSVGQYTILISSDLKDGIDDPQNTEEWLSHLSSAIYHMARAVELVYDR
ncbi:FG-GAP repeat domain-containing protein [Methanomethylovorans sp.]|uniref:FG-GAP repeat domain-containing protein n=1 Tax=Methanomethylovorans sp. TaxID=2758717 RepID=UPI00345ECBFA